MTLRIIRPDLIAIAIACIPTLALGQTAGPLPASSPAQCAQADDVLRNGSLAQTDSQLRALGTVIRCADPGSTVAAAMDRRRSVTSVPARGMGYDMHFFTPSVGDTAALRVALSIAGDAAAGLGARVMSLRLLLIYAGGGDLWYEDLTSTVEGQSCVPGGPREGALYDRSNLPSDSLERIRQRAAPLERDAAGPSPVRSAAHCVMNAWRAAKGLPVLLLLPDPRPAITVDHVCGNRFRIRNILPYTVVVQVEVEGASGRRRVALMRRNAGQSYGETELDVSTAGELRIFVDGDPILTKANGGTTCS